MTRSALFLLMLPLVACDDIRNTYEGLTNPLVAQGILLGIEAPESEKIPDLSQYGYGEGTGLTMFLADAESADALEEAPVAGADVDLRIAQTTVQVPETGGGVYTLPPSPDVNYAANAEWTVAAAVGDEVGLAHVTLPPPANATIAEEHTKGAPITFDLTGQGFTAVLVVVLDAQTGDITYSNEPEGIKEVYDFSRGNAEVSTVEVPGTAFDGETVYALGIAGLNHTTASEDIENMNTALSAVMAGKMRMFPVVTATIP